MKVVHRAIAARSVGAIDFLAPVFASSVGSRDRWHALLVGATVIDDVQRAPFLQRLREVDHSAHRDVVSALSGWGQLSARPQEWLSNIFEQLAVGTAVIHLSSPVATSGVGWLSADGLTDLDDSVRVRGEPWIRWRERGGALTRDSSNLIPAQYGVIGHGPWYLASGDCYGGHGLRLEYVEYVEPLRPTDPHRSALNDARLSPSGASLFDYVGGSDRHVLLQTWPRDWVQSAVSLLALVDHAARTHTAKGRMSHARLVVDALGRPGSPALGTDSFARTVEAFRWAKTLKERSFSNSDPSKLPPQDVLHGWRTAIAHLLRLSADEWQIAAPQVQALPPAIRAVVVEDWLKLEHASGVHSKQTHHLATVATRRLRDLLADVLQSWWLACEAYFRADLRVLASILTRQELVQSVETILNSRVAPTANRRVVLRECSQI